MTKYLFLLPLASAFSVQPNSGRPPLALAVGRGFQNAPVGAAEIARAHECVEKFGACDLEEIEELRDSIHDTRVQTMLVSKLGGEQTPVHVEDKVLEQRLLEEDLSLQLSLLQNQMPEAAFFHEEATMHPKGSESVAVPAGNQMALSFLDENLLESLVVCCVLGVIIFAPHLLN